MKSDVTRTVDVFLEGSQKPLLVVLGPTASGKTGFSIELAKNIHGEIVNADSRQLYRKLNIGTAKIMQGEMEGVPHHLIDILDPKEELTVSWYRERAEKIIDEIKDGPTKEYENLYKKVNDKLNRIALETKKAVEKKGIGRL